MGSERGTGAGERQVKGIGFLIAVHAAALAPLAWLGVALARGQLGFNPIREAILRTGRYALALLVVSLACTPVYWLTRWRQARVARKWAGLYGTFYAVLHLLVFAGWDYGFQWELIWLDVREKQFIWAGLLALAILIPLAITSTPRAMRRMGKRWKRLHRLVYLADLLAVAHFLLLVKADLRRPLVYAAIVGALLVVRVARHLIRGRKGKNSTHPSATLRTFGGRREAEAQGKEGENRRRERAD
jgi:sulfoxide reductase heme-binding subunit YedZ